MHEQSQYEKSSEWEYIWLIRKDTEKLFAARNVTKQVL